MLSKILCNDYVRTNSVLGLTRQVTFFFMYTGLIWLANGNETSKYVVIKYYVINTRVHTVSVEFINLYTSQFTAKLCRVIFLHGRYSERARKRAEAYTHTHKHTRHENRLPGDVIPTQVSTQYALQTYYTYAAT